LEDGTSVTKFNVADGSNNSLLSCAACASNNSTKATPVLAGDILGDWREEVIWRTADDRFLRIYTTTIPAANRLPALYQDPQYRLALAWQNVAYNQPPWPSFFIGPGMSAPPRPNIVTKASANVALDSSLIGRSGTADRCVWTVAVQNRGPGIAQRVAINDVALKQTAGLPCTPAILPAPPAYPGAFPVEIGDLDEGSRGDGKITIDFSSCAAGARFTANVALSANAGPASPLVLSGPLGCGRPPRWGML
jgi:hypothetical protein